MIIYMESLLIDSQQLVARDHPLLRRRRRRGDVYDSCSSSSSINEDEEDDDDLEVDSSSSSSSSSSLSPSPLQDMSSLLLQLPLKRGLSKHYNGKSESYTSLSNVKSLEDLAKQENPFNKKLKLCNSSLSRKKPSSNEGSQFSLLFNGRSSGFLGNGISSNN